MSRFGLEVVERFVSEHTMLAWDVEEAALGGTEFTNGSGVF